MADSLILPLAAPVLELLAGAEQTFSPQNACRTGKLRPRDQRVAMVGSGYRAILEGSPAAIVNLSMSGAQLRGAVRVLPDQPAVVKIGWPLDNRQCAVLARVRWVRFEPDAARHEGLYRVGMEFETWDVARLKEILRYLKVRTTSDF
jgi:hypothetical protein